MLSVARGAKASKEMLYRWHGEKTGLMRSLIERNAGLIGAALQDAPADDRRRIDTLRGIGPILLSMLMGVPAIALNRAAVADTSGTLGRERAASGRGAVAPLPAQTLKRALTQGDLLCVPLFQMVDHYNFLLIGDWQIRRATGAMPAPTSDWTAARCESALNAFRTFHPAPRGTGREGAHALPLDHHRRSVP